MKQKKLLRKILATALLAVIVGAGVTVATHKDKAVDAGGKLAITASYYPLYDFAKQVGGDKVQVATIVPSGVEPHDFEPSPKVLADAQRSKLFIYNGILEPWAADFASDYAHTAINTSKGIATQYEADEHEDSEGDHDHGNGALDPHFWLDPVLAQQIVTEIKQGLMQVDPGNKQYYAQRAAAYISELQTLDEQFKTGLAHCDQDTIVASHDAFNYVAHRYGFSVEAIAGLSPEAEPSAARLAELSDYVRTNHIKYVFFEALVSPRLAATIAQETGAQTSVLNPIEGLTHEDQENGKDYLGIQRENLANLRQALACH